MTWHDVAIAALLVDLLWRVWKGMAAAYKVIVAKMDQQDRLEADLLERHTPRPELEPTVHVFSFTDNNGRKH